MSSIQIVESRLKAQLSVIQMVIRIANSLRPLSSDGVFNIEILYMSIVIEFYESGAL